MAEILGKDLDKYDDSDIANAPFNLVESEIAGPRFMTGQDLSRSAKISAEWKMPIAIPSQAKSDRTVVGELTSSFLTGASDAVANMPDNVLNTVAQAYLEKGTVGATDALTFGAFHPLTNAGEYVSRLLSDDKNKDKLETHDKVVDILEGRIYPLDKYARRVIANATDNVESRKIVRELYNQAQGIDSSKLYNQGATIIGAMTPALVLTKGAYGAGRAFGAGRIAATNLATNVAKGYIGAEMAGQYAEETAAQYRERTGDTNFENFTAKDAKGLSAIAYGAIGSQIEFMGGVEPIMAGALNKVGLRSSLLSAGVKIGAGEATEEFLQGITETLMRKIDNTSDKTWAEGFKEALQGAAWGAVIGGGLGTTTFYTNRRNLVKGIKTALPNISEEEAKLVADAMIDSTAEMTTQNPTLRSNLREKVAMMYRDSDIDNKEQNIDAITDLEYSLITMDAAERGIELSEHELFSGVVNELGWFRKGIPENRIAEVQALNDEIKSLKDELAKENAQEEKNWDKIDELETKLAQSNQYILDKISDLARDDAMSIRRMLRNTEAKFVKKEKERATKKAIKSGNVDMIAEILSKAGFKTRNMSGTTIKELARLNWELLQDKDLGQAQSRGTVQRKLADIEANVESGNAVLLRAGYTQEMIDKMDDETWNRAILTQYRKEQPATDEDLVPDEALEELPDNFFQNRTSGAAPKDYRGAYIPAYRFIQRSNRMDASTLSHELAHDWMEVNFDRFRSGEATPDFMRSWGALEKALGIEENATQVPRKASETFARAYEAWITSNEDWSKFIAVEDKDKDKVEKLLQDYQGELRNIYNDINNKYFKETWGKLGELKPELKAWFDRVVNITDLDVLVERGELTPAQAENEKLNRAIDTVIESTTDEDATKELRKARLLNDTSRYEVEGGNQNSLQNRLSALAREIDDNNMTLKGERYNTRRDMMQVAEAADNFVKTRLDDALAIINGEMAEVEGLYKEDIYTALERLAVETGDMNLISELKNSEIANQLAKELGQRVAGFRNWKQSTEIDVFSALKSLDNNFNKALKNKKAQKQFDSALDLLGESLQNQDKVADKQLDSMLKEWECQ